VLVSWSTRDLHVHHEPLSAICSVMGALMFALFLVLLRRRVDNEDKLNMPMFYGLFRSCCITRVMESQCILLLTGFNLWRGQNFICGKLLPQALSAHLTVMIRLGFYLVKGKAAKERTGHYHDIRLQLPNFYAVTMILCNFLGPVLTVFACYV